MKNFPKQRLSSKEKSKNDYQWAKDTMDSILFNHVVDPTGKDFLKSDYNRKLANYQLFNNVLNQADFERECNPLGLEVGQFQDAIQPYNKTYNKIQVLLGEELQRPFPFKAVLVSSEGVKSKLAHRDYMLKQFVYSKIQSMMSQIQATQDKQLIDSTIESIMNPQEIEKYMRTTYLDSREILSNKILDYLCRSLLVKDKKNDGFKHALIAGEEFVYVGESNGTPVLSVPNTLGMFHHRSNDVKYVQYGLYAGYQTYMNSGDVLDTFGEYLTEEQAKQIDSTMQGKFGIRRDAVGPDMKYFHDDYDRYYYSSDYPSDSQFGNDAYGNDDWLVHHVEWRSQRKVGLLTFTNEFGDEEKEWVSEDFELPENYSKRSTKETYGKTNTYYNWTDVQGNNFTLQWKWIPEIWSGVRIGSDIYTMIGPKKQQFRSIDDPYDVRLGYHGLVYSAMNAPSTSLMDRMKPFQYLLFIIMHKMKKFVGQDQGKVFQFDTTMIDPTIGLEKTLYYLKEMNIHFFNPLQNADQPGWAQRGQIHGSIDMSNMQNIMNYIKLIEAIDFQISDTAGVNKQREGQVSANEAVTNAQANISMSSVITEIYFHLHQTLWESVLDSLLKIGIQTMKGKEAFKQYVLDDLSVVTLDLTSDSLDNSDVGVFISNISQDVSIFRRLEESGEAMVRANKASLSDMIKVLKATSTEERLREIEASEKRNAEMEQQAAEREIQAKQQEQEREHQFELYKLERELDTKVLVAEIGSFSRQMDQDSNDNNVPDQLEIAKLKADIDHKERKLDLEEKKLKLQEKALNKKPAK